MRQEIKLVSVLVLINSISGNTCRLRDPFFLPKEDKKYSVQKEIETKTRVYGIIEHKGVMSVLVSRNNNKLVVNIEPGDTSNKLSSNVLDCGLIDEHLCLRVEQ